MSQYVSQVCVNVHGIFWGALLFCVVHVHADLCVGGFQNLKFLKQVFQDLILQNLKFQDRARARAGSEFGISESEFEFLESEFEFSESGFGSEFRFEFFRAEVGFEFF